MSQRRHRILFVDENVDVLSSLEKMLSGLKNRFDFTFVSGGPAALESMSSRTFDVLVADLRMRGMRGPELLQRAAQLHPRTMRVALSGTMEIGEALRSVNVAHQFLSKPTKPAALLNVLERSLALRSILEDEELRARVNRLPALPSRPRLYHEITHVMNSKTGSLADVAALVQRDVALSTKVLQMANSAFFSRGTPVTSVELAVPRLGVDVVKAIALAFETSDRVSSALGGIVDTLSQHALEVAAICRNFAANVAERELAFTVGLMHDVGLLVKLALGDSPISFVHHHNGEPGSPKLGAYILGLWGLPQPIVEAVAYQDDPGQIRTEPNLARWVHVASRVAMDQPVEDENAAELVHIARAAYGRIRRVTAA